MFSFSEDAIGQDSGRIRGIMQLGSSFYLNALLTLIPGSDYRKYPEQMEQLMPWYEFMQDLRDENLQTNTVSVNTSIA